ncbi:MAG TPA: ATP-binding protein [Cytophagales bacterium]|nr:ATP-binding protein [Cytophagales bacterium]
MNNNISSDYEFLSSGGEMGQLIRDYNWSETPIGPIEIWPQSLKTCLRIMLTSRQPIWIGWGKELIKFYNDAYLSIVGGKHPWALGKPASIVWKDIWKDIEPLLKTVMEDNEGTYVESKLLIMERNGYPEETYYTFSYTPVPGDNGGIAGMFCANTDDTERIISQRQLKTLTQLGKVLTAATNNQEVIESTIETLKKNQQDFPFVLFYTHFENGAVIYKSSDAADSSLKCPEEINFDSLTVLSQVMQRAFDSRRAEILNDVSFFKELPKGIWTILPNKALILPISNIATKELYGYLVVGLNPYQLVNEKYLNFFTLLSDQIATSFANVRVLEEERKSAKALSEIDKAKTIFFSNISHEFRTPLTLLLGPMEEALDDPSTTAANRVRIDMAYRNAIRMQKLVNTLLDFSKIEAGRMEGRFISTDISTFTKDLVTTFSEAIEKTGILLHVDVQDISGNVYVDIDMWQKIVLNLISNAFKYTEKGEIKVSLTTHNEQLEFSVSDTGIGIPEGEKNQIFERFHRIENSMGRSQEGTGIGLSMVKELVNLHKGVINVESELGKGSTFTVQIPLGKSHLPKDKVDDSPIKPIISPYASSFVLEASKWISDKDLESISNHTADRNVEKGTKILIVDDNADLRDYITRLLERQYTIITAIDGEDAYSKILFYKPTLVLTDIMMPRLDGFGLLQKVRSHPDLRNIPVIFLSARAGEEAKVEGLNAGADDYLTKPFSAKELIARVETNIKIVKSRITAEQNLRAMVMQSPVATVLLRDENFIIDIVNETGLEIWGRKYEDVIGRPILEALPEIAEQGFGDLLNYVYTTGNIFRGDEVPVELKRHGKSETVYLNYIYQPLKKESGETFGIIAVGIDVSEQVYARKKVEQSERELYQLANAVPQLVWSTNENGEVLYFNNRISEYSGAIKRESGIWEWQRLIYPEDMEETGEQWISALQNGAAFQMEHRLLMNNGLFQWHLTRIVPHKDDSGQIVKWFGTTTNIHAWKEHQTILEQVVRDRTDELQKANSSLQRSNYELQQFAHVASHDLKEPLRKIKTFADRLRNDQSSILSEKGEVYLEKIDFGAGRMSTMIEGILNYSMIDTEDELTAINMDDVIKSIESDLEVLITEKQATLIYGELPVIEGVAILINQLFYNLLNNSLKFSSPGVDPIISISASTFVWDDIEYARFTVSDNGIGFEQAYTEKIFNAFTRLNSLDKYAGTGIGLAVCKKIVEKHSGKISAIGSLGKGATFIIELPLKKVR